MNIIRIQKQIGVACLAVLIVGAVACARTPMQKRDRFLESGKKLFEKKEYARAVLDFKNAVAAMPQDSEAYYELGRTYAAFHELQSAVNSFRKAISLDPKNRGAQLELSKIMASTIDPEALEDAENRLNTLLQSGVADPEALQTLALTELKLGKMDVAAGHLQQALGASPQSLKSSVLLATTNLGRGDFKGAEDVLQKACLSAPKSPDARVILGDFYILRNRVPEAEKQFQEALILNPNHGPALAELGKLLISLGRKADAEQAFKRLAALPDPVTRSAHAVFLLQEGRQDDAIREFEQLAKSDPDDRPARTRLVYAFISVGRKQDAYRVLQSALKKNPKDLDALLQRGELYLSDAKYALAESDVNQVLYAKPNSAEVHYILAQLHKARGSALLQRQELSEALRLNPVLLRVRLELAQLLINSNGAKTAMDVLDEAPTFQRRLLAVLVQRNWALWASDDLLELRKGIEQGLATARIPDLLIQDGLLKLRQGDPKGARASVDEALRLDPTDLRALDIIRQSYVSQKQAQAAVQKVREYVARSPRSAPAQEFLGSVLMASGDYDGARTALETAQAVDPTLTNTELKLVQLDVATKRTDEAQKRLEKLITLQDIPLAYLWLGNLEEYRGDHKRAIDQFRKVVEREPDNVQALNNLAYLVLEYNNTPDEALKYAEKATELAPDRLAVADTIGWILYRKGLYSSAVKHLERAAADRSNALSKYHLAMAYAKAGDLSRSRAVFKTALQTNPNLPEAKIASEVIEGSR